MLISKWLRHFTSGFSRVVSGFFDLRRSAKRKKNMSLKKSTFDLELVTANYVRNNYEKQQNKHIPVVLQYLITRFANKIIGGKIISFKQDSELFRLLQPVLSNIRKCQLLFRASDHNYSADKFHSLCNNKGPTITIIKSNYRNIYGGYTSRSWGWELMTSIGSWGWDPDAFLFLIKSDDQTLVNKCPIMFKIKQYQQFYAVFSRRPYGPSFGCRDICIYDNCVNKDLYANDYGIEGSQCSYDYGALKQRISLCGGDIKDAFRKFRVIDFEVFKLQ